MAVTWAKTVGGSAATGAVAGAAELGAVAGAGAFVGPVVGAAAAPVGEAVTVEPIGEVGEAVTVEPIGEAAAAGPVVGAAAAPLGEWAATVPVGEVVTVDVELFSAVPVEAELHPAAAAPHEQWHQPP